MFFIFLCIVDTTDLHQAKEYGYKTRGGKKYSGWKCDKQDNWIAHNDTKHILTTLYLEKKNKKNIVHWYKLNSGLNHADKFELHLCL